MPHPLDPVWSPTRRAFVKRAAATAALLGALPAGLSAALRPLAGPVPRTDDPDVLKVGLIGCGGRGTGAALQAVSAEDGTVKLVAMADVFADRIEASLGYLGETLEGQAAARLDVPPERRFTGFDGWQQLLPHVDVVLLATPPHFRPAMLAGAIASDKHVFCEKPVAVDGPGVRSVLASAATARERGLSLVSGFCWRYNVRHRSLYERVLAGDIGQLQAVYSTYNASPLGTNPRQPDWSEMEFQLRNWQHMVWLSGDHIVEQACHSLDKMAWAHGDVPPLRAVAVGGRQSRQGEARGNVFDHFGVTYEYADGAKGFHMCRQVARASTDNSDFLWGTKGRATINGWTPLHRIEGEHPWDYVGEGNDMYQQEHDELFASIRAGQPINDGTWMAHSTLLAIMGREAAYTGRTIEWDEILSSETRLGPGSYAFGELPLDPVAIPGQLS